MAGDDSLIVGSEPSWLAPDLHLLEDLVSISTSAKDSAGIAKVNARIEEQLEALGFLCFPDEPEESVGGPFLLAIKRAKNQVKTVTKISLIMHTDCVRSNKTGRGIEHLQGRAYGIGVADDKGGICAALRFLKLFSQSPNWDSCEIVVLCSPSEERGSLGWHKKMSDWSSGSDFLFGFEPALRDGSLISSRSGNRWIEIHVKGAATHAGRVGNPKENAAHFVGLLVAKVHALNFLTFGEKNEAIKINVGDVRGGLGVFNLTCGDCTVKIDARFQSRSSRDALFDRLMSEIFTLEKEFAVEWDVLIADDCPPMDQVLDPSFMRAMSEAFSEFGEELKVAHSGGAADINHLSPPRVLALDGLGPIGHNLHEKRESIELDSLWKRPMILARALDEYLSSCAVSQGQNNEKPVESTLDL